MTFTEFLSKYNGKYVEAGGSANALNQCVDLANQYIEEVLGLPKILWTNAIDFPKKAGSNYEWIPNTPTGVPHEGDLIIWGGNQYGHIAIFIEGNVNSFKSFDENWPTGSPAHVQGHTYVNVLGWLRFKKPVVTPAPVVTQAPQVDLSQYVSKAQYQIDLGSKQVEIDNLNAQLEEEKKELSALVDLKNSIAQTVMEQTEQIDNLKIQLKDAQNKNGLLVEQASKGQLFIALVNAIKEIWKKNS